MATEEMLIHQKLMSKISSQADLLGRSADYIEICEVKIRHLEKDKHEHSKQDDLLTESENLSIKLQQDVITKERQNKLNEKKILELGREIQKIKTQSETAQHALRFTQPQSNLSASQSKLVVGLRSEIDDLKAHLNTYQNQLESSKRKDREMTSKIFALEEALDQKSKYKLESGQADLLAKSSDQQKLIKKLKNKLGKKKKEMADAAATLVGNFSPLSKNNIGYNNRTSDDEDSMSSLSSHEEKIAALEYIIVSGQQKLSLTEKELKRIQSGEITADLKAIEAERDVLLEYIQGDMKKSSEVSLELEKVQSELQDCLSALQIQEGQAVNIESSYHAALERSNDLEEQLTTSQKEIKMLNEEYQCDNTEKNEEAKKGTYIISVLTGELKLARVKLQEVEQGQKNLEKYNETLKTLLKTAKMDVSKPVPCSSPIIAAATHPTPTEPSTHHSEELVFLRRERENWLYERSILERELDDLRPLDQALAQLVTDLKSPLNQLEPSYSIYSDDDEDPPLPPPPIHSKKSSDEIGGYGDMYANNRDNCNPNYMRGRSSTSSHSPLHVSYDHERGRGKIASPTRSINTATMSLPAEQKSLSSINQRMRHQSCPLSEKNSSWIALPSISRLSISLHGKIQSLAADLMFIESKYWRLEGKFEDMKKSLEKINAINLNKIIELKTSGKMMEKIIEETREQLQIKDNELEEHTRSTNVLHLTASALLTIPGGWRQYIDNPYSSLEISSTDRSSLIKPFPLKGRNRDQSPPPINKTSDKDNMTHWQDSTTKLNDDHSSPGPRKPLSASKRYESFDVTSNLSKNHAKELGKMPHHLIPKVVTQVVMALEKAFATDNFALSNAQSALRISEGDYQYLFNQMENTRLESEARNDAFVLIESNLRRDLEAALNLTEKQNILAKNLETKVETSVREKCFISAQLTAINHQNEGVKQQLYDMLREHVTKAGIELDPQKLPPFLSTNGDSLSLNMGDLIRYVKEILLIQLQPKHPYKVPRQKNSAYPEISTNPSSSRASSSASAAKRKTSEVGEKEGGLLPMTPMTPDSEEDTSDEKKDGKIFPHEYDNDNNCDDMSNIYDTSESAADLRIRMQSKGSNPMYKSRHRMKESMNRIGSRSIESNNIISINKMSDMNSRDFLEGDSSIKGQGRGIPKAIKTTDSEESPSTQLRSRLMKAQSSFASFRENISSSIE